MKHGNVTVYLNGFVASAATIISMGAKTVKASKYSMYLVHKCSNWINEWGTYNADQIQELIDKLKKNKLDNDKVDLIIANMISTDHALYVGLYNQFISITHHKAISINDLLR